MRPTFKKIGSLQVKNSTTATFTIHDRYRLQSIELWLTNAAGTSPASSPYMKSSFNSIRVIADGETIQDFTNSYEQEGRNWYNYNPTHSVSEPGNIACRFSDPALYSRGFGLEAYAHSALATVGLDELRIEIDWNIPTTLSVDRAEVWIVGDPEDKTPYKGTPHRRTENRQIPYFGAAGLQVIPIDTTRQRLIKALFWDDDDFNTVALHGIRNTGERVELLSTIDEQQLENIQKRAGRDYNTNWCGIDFDTWQTGAGIWSPDWQSLSLELDWISSPSGRVFTDYVSVP